MFRKVGVVVSSSAGGTTRALKRQMFFWGMARVYRFGLTAQMAPNAQAMKLAIQRSVERKAARLASRIQSSLANPKPRWTSRLIFSVMRRMQRGKYADYNPLDRDYWKVQGWAAGARPWKA